MKGVGNNCGITPYKPLVRYTYPFLINQIENPKLVNMSKCKWIKKSNLLYKNYFTRTSYQEYLEKAKLYRKQKELL